MSPQFPTEPHRILHSQICEDIPNPEEQEILTIALTALVEWEVQLILERLNGIRMARIHIPYSTYEFYITGEATSIDW